MTTKINVNCFIKLARTARDMFNFKTISSTSFNYLWFKESWNVVRLILCFGWNIHRNIIFQFFFQKKNSSKTGLKGVKIQEIASNNSQFACALGTVSKLGSLRPSTTNDQYIIIKSAICLVRKDVEEKHRLCISIFGESLRT